MQTESITIYRNARIAASVRNPSLTSMDRAANELFVSAKSLSDYETGRTLPPCDVVARMREVYGAHDLVGQHIRQMPCPLMIDYCATERSELARAALGWALAVGDAGQIAHQFAAVARDGHITPDEERAARVIRERAIAIAQVMNETVTAIDKALSEAGL